MIGLLLPGVFPATDLPTDNRVFNNKTVLDRRIRIFAEGTIVR